MTTKLALAPQKTRTSFAYVALCPVPVLDFVVESVAAGVESSRTRVVLLALIEYLNLSRVERDEAEKVITAHPVYVGRAKEAKAQIGFTIKDPDVLRRLAVVMKQGAGENKVFSQNDVYLRALLRKMP